MVTKFPSPLTPSPKNSLKQTSQKSSGAFRACYQQFQECLEFSGLHSASPLLEAAASFVLDFEIVAKRTFGADSLRYRLFQAHFLRNQDRAACCRALRITEWTFASEVIQIEASLETAMTRAGLFPLALYFRSEPGILAA